MYPIFRTLKEVLISRFAPKLGPFDTHISNHICWPWDLDMWMELNNGRTLTLFDLGRMGHGVRVGLFPMMKRERWMITIAGASVRYRKRTRAFSRFEMHTRMIGWDDKFFYIEQSTWRHGDCIANILLRAAITDRSGLVRAHQVAKAMDLEKSPSLPEWVTAWSNADQLRPWPPVK